MVDTLLMPPEEPLHEDVSGNRKMFIVLIAAVLLVAVMVAVIWTLTNIKQASADFRDDCRELGGEAHDLGNEDVCLLDNHVIGRQ